jgi:hypothetical protein
MPDRPLQLGAASMNETLPRLELACCRLMELLGRRSRASLTPPCAADRARDGMAFRSRPRSKPVIRGRRQRAQPLIRSAVAIRRDIDQGLSATGLTRLAVPMGSGRGTRASESRRPRPRRRQDTSSASKVCEIRRPYRPAGLAGHAPQFQAGAPGKGDHAGAP